MILGSSGTKHDIRLNAKQTSRSSCQQRNSYVNTAALQGVPSGAYKDAALTSSRHPQDLNPGQVNGVHPPLVFPINPYLALPMALPVVHQQEFTDLCHLYAGSIRVHINTPESSGFSECFAELQLIKTQAPSSFISISFDSSKWRTTT